MSTVARLSAIVVTMLAAGGASLSAHHDVMSYDQRSVTIEADLVSLSLRNPHSFMFVSVRAPGKPAVRYEVEWSGADALRRAGIVSTTLKTGDRIILTGQPGRESSTHRLRLTLLRRPKDGLRWVEIF
jgi:hypothetical protein